MDPNPNTLFPIEGVERTCFLKNIIDHPQILVGDFSYYDDPEDVHNFLKNVLYLFPFMEDRLIIKKFCQIATGVRFIMNGSNHSMKGISTYPFKVFGKSWADAPMDVKSKGDTIIGNDVWIGNSATIMQGVTIGDGAIIGTNALVIKDVEPYSIVGGNPAKEIRRRFTQTQIDFLLHLAWWDLPMQTITKNIKAIAEGDFKALEQLISS